MTAKLTAPAKKAIKQILNEYIEHWKGVQENSSSPEDKLKAETHAEAYLALYNDLIGDPSSGSDAPEHLDFDYLVSMIDGAAIDGSVTLTLQQLEEICTNDRWKHILDANPDKPGEPSSYIGDAFGRRIYCEGSRWKVNLLIQKHNRRLKL